MCSLTWETHVTRDMCFLGRGTQIPSDMCSPTLTGSGQLSLLGTGLVETLGKIALIREKKLSKHKFVSIIAYKNYFRKPHFRLTCVAQKRLCLSSLMFTKTDTSKFYSELECMDTFNRVLGNKFLSKQMTYNTKFNTVFPRIIAIPQLIASLRQKYLK